ncbi:hypothetical protein CQ13_39435 [Bradyrhizobium retamae]|uniref:Serine dehydratase beta chain domain-containing protein n=2 Tax=Bradyrhizobium retamae TaxID=1300035 RepID=A0A0R3N8H8_9BRAD|nr:hypothetical protein CQ13_39435 [Bradyrhizobium retamae]
MQAAATFVRGLPAIQEENIDRIKVTFFGSLAWTGKGHAKRAPHNELKNISLCHARMIGNFGRRHEYTLPQEAAVHRGRAGIRDEVHIRFSFY